MGAYVCPERIERGGFLVAYAGEVMSEEEARRRGILSEPRDEPGRGPEGGLAVGRPAGADKTRAELLADADALGVKVPKGAAKARIAELIREASDGD